MVETVEIPRIEETTGDDIRKDGHFARYTPPSNEPVRAKIPMAGTGATEVWITGNYSDLVDVISNRALVYRDYVREDSSLNGSDVHGNDGVIAVRAGRLNDLAVLYGVVYKGGSTAMAVDVVRFYIRDGADIGVEVVGSEVFVTYGRKKDLRTRFAYNEATGWKRSPGNNRGGSDFPLATEFVPSARLPQ